MSKEKKTPALPGVRKGAVPPAPQSQRPRPPTAPRVNVRSKGSARGR